MRRFVLPVSIRHRQLGTQLAASVSKSLLETRRLRANLHYQFEYGSMRLVLALLILLFAGPVCAEQRPDQSPILRIDAGAHLASIKRISVSADGRLLATGSDDKTARLWNLANGQLIRTFRVPISPGNDGKKFIRLPCPLTDGCWPLAAGTPRCRHQGTVGISSTSSTPPMESDTQPGRNACARTRLSKFPVQCYGSTSWEAPHAETEPT